MAARIFRRLRDLLDVNAGSIADGETLVWDAAEEEFIPGAAGGGGASALVDLTDVTGEPPATGEAPVWDGDSFELTDVLTAAEAAAGFQPLDSDLTAIAALSTTAFGRGLLILANQAALLSAAGAAAASHNHAGEDIASGTVADARIASTITRDSELTAAIAAHEAAGDPHPSYTTAAELAAFAQPLDSDLTSIAALTTTAFGRSFLALADAAAARALVDLEPGTDIPSLATFEDHSARHEDGGADEISIAGLSGTPAALTAHEADTTSVHGIADTSALLDTADIGVTVQAFDADLSTYAGITPSANVQAILAAANYAAIRALLDLEAGTDFPSLATFNDHSARHENGGGDEISVAGLSGELADAQPTDAAHVDSGAATDGHVLTADGAGGAAFEAPTGGSAAADDVNLILHMEVYA